MELYLRVPATTTTFDVQDDVISCDEVDAVYKEVISKFLPSILSQFLESSCVILLNPKFNWNTTKTLLKNKLHNHFGQITSLTAFQVKSSSTYLDLFDVSKQKKLSNSISIESQLRKKPILHKNLAQLSVDQLLKSVAEVSDPIIITLHTRTRRFSLVNIALNDNFDEYDLISNILANKRSLRLEDVIPRFIFKSVTTRNTTKIVLTLESNTHPTYIKSALGKLKLVNEPKTSSVSAKPNRVSRVLLPNQISRPSSSKSREVSRPASSKSSHIPRPSRPTSRTASSESSQISRLSSPSIKPHEPMHVPRSKGHSSIRNPFVTSNDHEKTQYLVLKRCSIKPPRVLPNRVMADISTLRLKQLAELSLQIHSQQHKSQELRTLYTNAVNELATAKLSWNQALLEFNYQHMYNFSEGRTIEINKTVIREKTNRQLLDLCEPKRLYDKFTESLDLEQSLFNAKMKHELMTGDNIVLDSMIRNIMSERTDYQNKVNTRINEETYKQELEKLKIENENYKQSDDVNERGEEMDSLSDTVAEILDVDKSLHEDMDVAESLVIDDLDSISDFESTISSVDVDSYPSVDKTTDRVDGQDSEFLEDSFMDLKDEDSVLDEELGVMPEQLEVHVDPEEFQETDDNSVKADKEFDEQSVVAEASVEEELSTDKEPLGEELIQEKHEHTLEPPKEDLVEELTQDIKPLSKGNQETFNVELREKLDQDNDEIDLASDEPLSEEIFNDKDKPESKKEPLVEQSIPEKNELKLELSTEEKHSEEDKDKELTTEVDSLAGDLGVKEQTDMEKSMFKPESPIDSPKNVEVIEKEVQNPLQNNTDCKSEVNMELNTQPSHPAKSQNSNLFSSSDTNPTRKSSRELHSLRENLIGNVSKWAQKFEQLSTHDSFIPKPNYPIKSKYSALDSLRFSPTKDTGNSRSSSRVSSNGSAKLHQVD